MNHPTNPPTPGGAPGRRRRRNRHTSGAARQSRPDTTGEDGSAAAQVAVSFADLGVPAPLVAALAADGIVAAFPIQAATMADALAGRDLLGQGRTGSGKTLAFAVPLVTRLAGARSRPGRPRGLVVVPTRELATQVATVIEPLASAVGLSVATVFGGVAFGPQLRAFERGVDIIVACPGRLLDHLRSSSVHLDAVSVCVLDEADHMADQGFLPMVRTILDATAPGGQRLLFSATLAGGVDAIVRRYLVDPVSHQAQVDAPVTLVHEVLVVDETDRFSTLVDLVRGQRAVVFARTKHRARQFAKRLNGGGVRAVDLHGNLSQPARERNLAAFADGSAAVLVATDIAARGIHVDDVPLVVHVDPPVEHKAYTHRSGRTGRAGASGRVVTIASTGQVGDVRSLLNKASIDANWETGPVCT